MAQRKPRKWPLPDSHTGIGEAEAFARFAANQVVQDYNELVRTLVGKDGRGFMTVKLTPEEADMQYRALREQDDPAVWAYMLSRHPDAQSYWRRMEKRYQESRRAS